MPDTAHEFLASIGKVFIEIVDRFNLSTFLVKLFELQINLIIIRAGHEWSYCICICQYLPSKIDVSNTFANAPNDPMFGTECK